MKYNDKGEELPDSTPMEVPLHWKRPPTLNEQIRAAIRSVVSEDAVRSGHESFEEANDFDVMDEASDPSSRYEIMEDDEFRSAERLVLDKAKEDMDNIDAAMKQRKGDEDESEQKRVDGSGEGVDRNGKERGKAGGKGRSAGGSGERVSEGESGD